MKRVLVVLSICLGLVVGATAMVSAKDGATLYKMCGGCHGADGSKLAMGTGVPLKGQSADELYTKMQGYKEGSYGMAKKRIMQNLVKRLNDTDMKTLADHIAGF